MNKEFVPYTEAFELKEIGFDEPCFGRFYYPMLSPMLRPNSDEKELFYESGQFVRQTEETTLSPTYSQCFRWFREKHDLVHHINRDGGWWLCSILDLYDEKEQGAIETHIDNCYPDTYEEAELACLRKLIEIVKNK